MIARTSTKKYTKWKFSNYIIHYSKKSYHSNLTKNYSLKVCFAYLEIGACRIKKIGAPSQVMRENIKFHCKMVGQLQVL